MNPAIIIFLSALLTAGTMSRARAQDSETLPRLTDGKVPGNFEEMWAGFDPRAEPLEVEVVREWEHEGVVLRIVRFRIGVFKGRKATLAAIYGFPQIASNSDRRIPGLVQIHGGGQYADHRACLTNAKRGYATVSIAWAGRISAPDYHVTPTEVKLFWEGKTDNPAYRVTTDWGAVDGYHAPGRNPGNVFPSARPAPWTLDDVESPRNSGWFLCALAARRALTFLERQPEVDPHRLGVYGHSMGGKLTVMTAVDPRVKAAAPSCGGISDRYNTSSLFRSTVGDDVSLKHVSCPVIFLSPSNDFHGRIGDLPRAVDEVRSAEWRVTCSPHHNHQDTPDYEVATQLWFDNHLKKSFEFPGTPETELTLQTADRVPVISVTPDRTRPVASVDVYYTRQGRADEEPGDRQQVMHRFWHHARAVEADGAWRAQLPVASTDQPLWVYANVTYPLEQPISGAGYYYREFTARSFNVSSLLEQVAPGELQLAGVRPTLRTSLLIEDFEGDWEKEWFTYDPQDWPRSTHKVHDPLWRAPPGAVLALRVRSAEANTLVVVVDNHAAAIQLGGGSQWEDVVIRPDDLKNIDAAPLRGWSGIRRLKLTSSERLRPRRGSQAKPKLVGGAWSGPAPEFQRLQWQTMP